MTPRAFETPARVVTMTAAPYDPPAPPTPPRVWSLVGVAVMVLIWAARPRRFAVTFPRANPSTFRRLPAEA